MKILIVSDTHNKIFAPSSDYDITIHLGDAVDRFNIDYANIKNQLDAFRSYDYYVAGNHEKMIYNLLVNKFADKNLRYALQNPDEYIRFLKMQFNAISKIVMIEKYKFWMAHYLFPDSYFVADAPLNQYAEFKLIENIASTKKYDFVLWGHTHTQFVLKLNGVWFINPGFGAKNEYIEIIISGKDVCVEKIN